MLSGKQRPTLRNREPGETLTRGKREFNLAKNPGRKGLKKEIRIVKLTGG